MAEYSFNALKSNEKAFVAMTSLNVKEFLGLLERFSAAYQTDLHARGKRVDETRGRSDGKLALIEDKLFFILFYLKTYPLQEVLAYSFERLAKSDKLSCSIFSIDRTPHIQPIFYSI
ncbi:MAG: transposase family protein [Candidatus Thiothrix putei]|uniref:Transposase family protein n=1 Tax=Candidatus Thiothrix putei TaxID=3080811 RepID=A0AA95HDB7_9GAMM|nr:MAG: transposase family protein [Candidatus Thiothrix putei]